VYRPLRPSPEAAVEAEAAGVDAFIAVGFEAGGHAGHDCIPTFVLIPEIVDTVRIPVIAGGGIVDGRGAAAALCLGAQGVFMGTRFIATTECTAHQNVKEAILAAGACNTTTVGGTVGTLRALKTPLIERCIDLESRGGSLRDISDLYRPGYAKGMIHGDVRDGVFVCGAGVGLIKEIVSAADVLRDVVKEAEQVMARVLMSEAREGGFEGSTGW
jgi:NAD(P)H-dependent flavin oxidoreductase YrpB (nitropropane dioxygenase family)